MPRSSRWVREVAGQLDLFSGSSPSSDETHALRKTLHQRSRDRLRAVWRMHRHLHDKFSLDEALSHPTVGPVLRCHAQLNKVIDND